MKNIAEKNFKSELKFVYSDNDTLSIIFQKNDILLGVVGEFNNNIKQLEKITNTNIYTRGNSILVKSSAKKNELVKNAIKFLSEQFIINGTIEKKDIISSVNKFMIDEKNNSRKNIEINSYGKQIKKTFSKKQSTKHFEYIGNKKNY